MERIFVRVKKDCDILVDNMGENKNETNDHDLLIELRIEFREQMTAVRDDIKEIKDGTARRIQVLETEKADRKDIEAIQKRLNEDHEVRLKSIESKQSIYAETIRTQRNYLRWYTGVVVAIGTVISGLITYHIFHP